MKEKFKAYLEEQFKKIRPTLNAMKYREETLTILLDRAQELKIKGIEDEELIYLTCIDELGDFERVLQDFDAKEIATKSTKRKIGVGAVISLVLIVMLTFTYLIVGFVSGVWHPTWLIMVGGIFAGIAVGLSIASIKLVREKKYLLIRFFAVIIEVMLAVFVFLVMQVGFFINGSWMAFIAMVALIFGIDTILAFLTNSKLKWIELPIFVEIFSVMLFVILGIATTVWHPMWLICLGGVAFVLVQLSVYLAKRARRKNAEEGRRVHKFNKEEREEYWTSWND